MKKVTLYISIILLLFGCQNDDFEAPYYYQKIVVDGWIEQNQPARVFLTLSAPFFSEIDSASLRKLVITRAKVTISDGTSEEVLTLRKNNDYFPPYLYESTTMIGNAESTYQLKVEYGGITLTASTTIPEPQLLDSIWFETAPGVDTAGYIMISFTDEPEVNNYYRLLSKSLINDSKFKPVFIPNLDGRLIDGQKVTLSLSEEENYQIKYFKENDTVDIKFCTVDLTSYDFWSSLNSEIINSQNPFASSNAHVKSNIEGGLGIWAGYGVNTYRVICKEKSR